MIRALHTSLSRAFVVLALMAVTMWAGMISAEARILNSAHVARGEVALADGGWSSACEGVDQVCAVFPEGLAGHGMLDIHHHHADCQFNSLPAHIDEGGLVLISVSRTFIVYQSMLKPALLAEVDQPPKA